MIEIFKVIGSANIASIIITIICISILVAGRQLNIKFKFDYFITCDLIQSNYYKLVNHADKLFYHKYLQQTIIKY